MNQRASLIDVKHLTWIEVEPLRKSKSLSAEDIHKQLVQTDKGNKVDVPVPNSFLGQQSQTVDRQTVSRNKTVVMGEAAKPHPMSEAKTNRETKPQTHTAKRDAMPMALAQLGISILPKPGEMKTPQKDEPVWADQGSNPQDYVKGMRESDRTALNTKEFVFYSYFQRIRSRLDRAWVPILREKLITFYRSGRHLASDMDHSTKVLVILNTQGEITNVKVLSASEAMELDDAAIRAFNAAGPFPNPPHGIVDATGTIQIPWEFILKT